MAEARSIRRRRAATRRRAALVVAVTALAAAGLPFAASATPATDGNPDLAATCGLDVTLIIDDSASINSTEADQMRSAANQFATALVGTPSRLKVVTFDTRAQGVSAAGTSTPVLGNVVFRDPALYSAPTSGAGQGGTNWDDGLEVARRSAGGPGDLVVFLTDGDPTYRNTTQPNGHADAGNHGISGTGSSVSTDNVTAAVTEADLIKASGAHMFGIGIGTAGAASVQRLNDVTGDEELTLNGSGVPNRPFGEADYTIASNFSALGEIVSAFVRDLCAPSVNVTKVFQRADGSTADATGADPWTFSATVSPTPTSWSSPAGASGATAVRATGATGGASFVWKQQAASASVDVVETAKPGWVYNGAVCTRNLLDGSNPTVIFNSVGPNQAGAQGDPSELLGLSVGLNQSVSCDVVNRQLRPTSIQVVKQTVPAGLSDTFDFEVRQGQTVIGSADDIGHGQSGTVGGLSAGTYSVVEASAPGYTLTSATCDDLGTLPAETASPASLTVTEGQSWRCTFVNTALPGSLRIDKVADGADGTFDFTTDVPDLGDVSITTDDGAGSSSTLTVPVGTYSISEDSPAPWSLDGAICTGEQEPESVFVGPGQDVVCTFTNTAPDPTISVTKTAVTESVAEPSGAASFTVAVTNTSVEPVTISAITDAIDGGSPLDLTATGGPITATTCDDLVGTELAVAGPGATATCSFTATVSGNAGQTVTDVVTVSALDSDDNEATDSDDASVRISATPPQIAVTKTPSVPTIAEPGGSVTYTVGISNTGVETVEIDSVTDAIEGGAPFSVTATGGAVTATTCGSLIGSTLTPGDSTSCAFTISHIVDRSEVLPDGDLDDTVTVTVTDDDDQTVSAQASAEVQVTDTLPEITVTKSASPATVAETAPGQTRPVTYLVTIQNDSVEPVEITSLTDAVEGGAPFAPGGTCDALVGTTLAPQAGTSCEFTLGASGGAGDSVTDVVTVVAADDDGNSTSDSDSASVTFTDLPSSLAVTKIAAPASVPEPGGPVTFTVGITNTSAADVVTLGAITDSVDGGAPFAAGGTCAALIGAPLAPGASTSCSFTLSVTGAPGDVVADTVSVTGVDDDGGPVSATADESVAITDVASSLAVTKSASTPSVTEPGGPVTFTVGITNTSSTDAVTLDSVTDSVDGGAPFAAGGSCPALLGTTLPVGGSTSCSFTLTVSGSPGDTVTDVVAVSGTDDDGGEVSATASEVVGIDDAPGSLSVTKTASVPSVPEPGGPVTFTVGITNTSPADTLTLTQIVDAVDGGLPVAAGGSCPALIGTGLAPGASTSCAFTLEVTGNAGDVVADTVTVTGTDDAQQPVTAQASETVDVTDVAPSGTVIKSADPTSVAEPGGPVTFSVTVTNTSTAEAAVLTSLTDTVGGQVLDLTAVAGPITATSCVTGISLAPGASTSCSFTFLIDGANAGDVVTDTVTATLADDDGGSTTPSDTAQVTVTDVLPSITVTKDNGGAVLDAPGGEVETAVTVTNTSVEPVTLTSLTDSVDGGPAIDITVTGDEVVATDCAVGGVIPVGGSYSCSFTALVASDEAATIGDVVTATAADDELNAVTAADSATVTIRPVADLAIDLIVDGDLVASPPDPRSRVDGEGRYLMEVTNLGPSTAADAEVVHTVPAGLTAVAAAADGWACVVEPQQVTCETPDLAPGESATIAVDVTIAADMAAVEITSEATVSALTFDPQLANNVDSETVTVGTPEVDPGEEERPDPPTTPPGPPAGPGPTGSQGPGALARTGAALQIAVLPGLILVAAGALVVWLGRRRFA